MVGFTNEGNSCYFNSALACFAYTPYIANNYQLFKDDISFCVEFKKMISTLHKHNFDNCYVVDTKNLLSKFKKQYVRYNNNHQHDSHEVFMCFTDLVPPVLKHVFEGELKRCVSCTQCKNVNSVNEPFTTLLFENKNSFEKSFSQFFANSKIDDYKCEKCKCETTAIISTYVSKCPKVVVIKTQSYNPKQEINFGNLKFELYAVVKYSGNSRYGHYTSMVKSHDVWYDINDECSTVMNNPVVIHNSSILFYKQMQL